MIYTYLAPGDTNLLLEELLQSELGAAKLTTPFEFVHIPEYDVIVFLNFENNPEFEIFVKFSRVILQCRTIYVTEASNNCERSHRGHYNMAFAEASVVTDLPLRVENYVNGNLNELIYWKSRWKK